MKKEIIDFAEWYSGMKREKVERAYNRYLREVKPDSTSKGLHEHVVSNNEDRVLVCGSFPSDNEIETAALNYRDKSDDENTNEDTMMIETHWFDKQEAFTAGAKWFIQNYL